jgi:hypothetical protein
MSQMNVTIMVKGTEGLAAGTGKDQQTMTGTRSFQSLLAAAVVLLPMTTPAVAASARNYFFPDYLGQPLAFCLDGNRDCGRPAATAWCKANGYDDALSFARQATPATEQLRYADSGKLCTAGKCIGFRQIKCIRDES